jgi:hypothetical protein
VCAKLPFDAIYLYGPREAVPLELLAAEGHGHPHGAVEGLSLDSEDGGAGDCSRSAQLLGLSGRIGVQNRASTATTPQ